MSGPKVVRIVTREEIEALCRRLLARLDAAIATWRRRGTRNGVLDEIEIQAVLERSKQLSRSFDAGDFSLIQKQVPTEMDFLEQDLADRLEKKAEQERHAKENRRRERRAARQILIALKGHEGPEIEEIKSVLNSVANDKPLPGTFSVSAIISKALELLDDPTEGEEISAEQRRLAAALGDGGRRLSIDDWLAEHGTNETTDPAIARADTLIGTLETLTGPEIASKFSADLASIEADADIDRQKLRLDSFIINVAEAARRATVQSKRAAVLQEKLAELSTFAALEDGDLAKRLEVAIEKGDGRDSPSLLAAADSAIAYETGRIAAESRRDAVLQGLASLGYEVHEGLKTELANNRPVVVNNPATPGFGVEVVTPQASKLCQMRVVAFSSNRMGRDAYRERDIETQWCGDLDKLRGFLADRGSDLAIERTTDAGAVPLKVVELIDVPAEGTGAPTVTTHHRMK